MKDKNESGDTGKDNCGDKAITRVGTRVRIRIRLMLLMLM